MLSELTAEGSVRYLYDERNARRLYILHSGTDFQLYAAECTERAAVRRGMAVKGEQLEAGPEGAWQLLERVRAWKPDAIRLIATERPYVAPLIHAARAPGSLPLMLCSSPSVGREFADLVGPAADGYEFTDLFLRNDRATAEERVLTQRLVGAHPEMVLTGNHGFGWDILRLASEAVRVGGAELSGQVAFLESLRAYPGATGPLTFTADDHNGRAAHPPNPISRLVAGQYVTVSASGR
jgi:Periplasmic binding protein